MARAGRTPGEEVPLVGVDADGWLGDLLSGQADRRLRPMSTPAGFSGELRPYQERGLSWLAFLGELGLGGILADDMGLGKTIQLLSLISAPAGPRSAAPRCWCARCRWSATGSARRRGSPRTCGCTCTTAPTGWTANRLAEALAGADLVITTYGVATRDQAALGQVTWARVVCDEAQNIKNHATKQARAVRALPAAARIALTGTPVENRLSELWSIMDFTNPGLLGPAERFRERYAVPIERHGSPEATEALKRLTQPFVLRRLKTDKTIISDLPDKQEMKVCCNLTPSRPACTRPRSPTCSAASRRPPTTSAAAGWCWPPWPSSSRCATTPPTCSATAPGCRAGPASWPGSRRSATRSWPRATRRCASPSTPSSAGCCSRTWRPGSAARCCSCTAARRRSSGTRWSRRSASSTSRPLFLLSLKAGGTGLNLTAASHVIHVDRWWNPAVEDQATDRAFRIGQRRNVQVRKFVCVGTLEERIDAMIEEKKALAEQIVGTGEGWLTELSTDDLRAVLTLSADAVSE